MSNVERKLSEMGYVLPDPPSPLANYIPGYRSGNLVFLSGVGPRSSNGDSITGRLGKDLTVEQGYEAAKLCGLNLLANLKLIIGDLDKVDHIVKVLGMVNSAPDFGQQPDVINGCSDLLVGAFAEKGKHGRSAVGMNAVPHGIAVEIEMIVEVRDSRGNI